MAKSAFVIAISFADVAVRSLLLLLLSSDAVVSMKCFYQGVDLLKLLLLLFLLPHVLSVFQDDPLAESNEAQKKGIEIIVEKILFSFFFFFWILFGPLDSSCITILYFAFLPV